MSRRKTTKKEETRTRPILGPCSYDESSGCLHCSLLAFSRDFEKYAATYERNAVKIRQRAKEPHECRHRLNQEPFTKVDVLFVGEAPHDKDDTEGTPFKGRAGVLLRDAISEIMPDVSVGFAYVVRCRTPRNRVPNKTEIRSCGFQLIKEIKKRKPKLLVALGNLPLKFLTGQSGVSTMTGNMLKSTHTYLRTQDVLSCLNPAYVMRANNDYELERFCAAIQTAHEYVKGEYRELAGKGTYRVLTTIKEVKELIDRFKREGLPVAIDTETGGLSPFQTEFPRLLCWGFSNKSGEGFIVPFDHVDSIWRDGAERVALIKQLRRLWCDVGVLKIAQNLKFDYQHGWNALGVEPSGFSHDTMLIHWTLDEQKGTHGLKSMAFKYTGMGAYDADLDDYIKANAEADPARGGSYAHIPGDILFPYVGMDADVTIRCYEGLRNEDAYKNNEKFQNLAETYFPRLTETLARMEYAGASISLECADELERYYSAEMAKYAKKIRSLPRVRKFVANKRREGKTGKKKGDLFYFNPGSPQQLQELLFGYYRLEPVELTEAGFTLLVARYTRLLTARKAKKDRSHVGFKFSDVVTQAKKDEDWSVFSTKADALHEFERKGNELAPLLIIYRGVKTLYDNFVRKLRARLDSEAKVHGSFLIHGTSTGRVSCRNPNLQNIPNKGGGRVKQAYISRFGEEGVLLQHDYSQIELRITACFYQDPVMQQSYIDDADLHLLTTLDISGMTEEQYFRLDSHKQKEWRVRGKRVNFLTVYGGGALGLMTVLRKDGVFLTLDESADMIARFYAARPVLKRNIELHSDAVRRNGYCDTFTGRRRRVPEVFSDDEEIVARALRQTINAPIQGGAADMTLIALVLISDELRRRKFDSIPIITVHDSIMIDCVVDEVFEVAAICKDIMETLPHRTEDLLPGVSWDWLTVPIKSDCELGTDWGRMVGFDLDDLNSDAEPSSSLFNSQGFMNRDPVTVDEIWDVMDYKLRKKVD